ncbi:MAG: 50S ribosomal protein L24 [Planctomycetes bacterium RBG_16_64_12]|nr:MAG: 50S ribosomal protein L24 [Planctomycetes bacterium RBG_16_64_12]
MHIRVDDTVEIITGDDRGTAGHATRGKVIRVDRKAGKVVVEGVNLVYKHVRRSQKNPQGGRLHMEMPIDASNVRLVCERCGKATRAGVRYLDDGAKERFCKKCRAGLGQIAPPRRLHAKKK